MQNLDLVPSETDLNVSSDKFGDPGRPTHFIPNCSVNVWLSLCLLTRSLDFSFKTAKIGDFGESTLWLDQYFSFILRSFSTHSGT